MGNGEFDGAKLSLFATFLYEAEEEDFQSWERALRASSKELFDATDGYFSIGQITIYNNWAGIDKADLRLSNVIGASTTSEPIKPPAPGSNIILRADEVGHPGVIVHEFGHYLFDLEDEYRNDDGGGSCTADAAGESACIMEFSWLGLEIDPANGHTTQAGSVTEFCCKANHGTDNYQETIHGMSCWDQIEHLWGAGGQWANHPHISSPSPGERPSGPPPNDPPEELLWIVGELGNQIRIVTAYSAGEEPGRDDNGQAYFMATLQSIAEELDVTTMSFAPDGRIDELDSSSASREGSPIIELNSMTQLLDELKKSESAGNQRLLWLGSESHFDQQQVAEIAQSIRKWGHFVHAVGEVTSDFQIEELAARTNGVYRVLFESDTNESAVVRTQQYVCSAFEMTEHWGAVDVSFEHLPRASSSGARVRDEAQVERYSIADLQRVAKRRIDPVLRANRYDRPVFVEEGASSVAFALCQSSTNQIGLYVQRPNGTTVDPNEDGVTLLSRSGYQLFVVNQQGEESLSGRWLLRAERTDVSSDAPFCLLGYSKNRQLQSYLRVEPTENISRVRLVASAHAILPLAHLEPVVANVTEFSSSGIVISRHCVPLLPSLRQAKGDKGQSIPSANGTLIAEIDRKPDSWLRIQVELVNSGRALRVSRHVDRYDEEQENELREESIVPPFVRVHERVLGPISGR